jgi:pimeloyl-ACP methyl ester carboxylesterase
MKKILKIAVGFALVILISTLSAYFVLRRDDIAYETLETKYADTSSRYIELANEVRVHYKDLGSAHGHTLLLIHGQSSSADAWNAWSDRLRDNYRVISIDLPGHGLTRAPADYEASVDGFADVIDELVRRLGLDGFTLVGHSMGGHVAWTYAARNPDQLKALVLIASGGLRPPASGGSLALMSSAMRFFGPVMADLDPAIGLRMAMRASFNDAEVPDSSIVRAAELLRAPGHREIALRITISRGRESDVERDTASLTNIKAPTLILWGEADRVAPLSYAALFGRAIRESKVITYAGVGHVPQTQAADKTSNDLKRFLIPILNTAMPPNESQEKVSIASQ